MKNQNNVNVKKLVLLAMLAAISFTIAAVVRIPVVLFLKYEPKDVVITIGAFLFGPMSALIVSVVVSFLEMITISTTGPIGFVMNVLSTCSFCCMAAWIYKKKRTMGGAILGLTLGSLLMIAAMILWNWLITPLYMNKPRNEIQALLIPAFLPFNALKAGLNSALVLGLYKPVVTALRKIHLVAPRDEHPAASKLGVYLLSGILLITCVILVLVFNGTI